MRQIVLDTETTGLETSEDHRIIEIGCVELVDRRLTGNNLHIFLNPQREVDEGAIEIHGLDNEFLSDKPTFDQVASDFLNYVRGSQLVIHNAPFDVGFLDHELRKLGGEFGVVADHCTVLDTLVMAREKHPGQKNSLDALCKRYGVDNAHRELHGALLDAEILAEVYLLMTGGQTRLSLGGADGDGDGGEAAEQIRRLPADRAPLRVIAASDAELAAHREKLESLDDALWDRLRPEA